MTIELYAAPTTDSSEAVDSPISSTSGELPDQEPALDLGDLLGSFDSREEAVNFVQNQVAVDNEEVADTHITLFNAYTHVELLTVTIQSQDQSTLQKNYYLVSDEGY
ncbi:hypothetical protein [Spirosoma sp. KNUC1025]|uniref:hypothetical protein n=1 Tax=Spirosoma sp. KNUC1025 TaxID=2894082 RepID=UPI00387057F6|nr:hypothetical protein LN737_17440 [Spirosoma sp. KNUC1025]